MMWRKFRLPILTILAVLLTDQSIKLYIKATHPMGEVTRVLGDWFIIHFTENPGMAFGLEFGGDYGKLALSVFRILAVIGGFYYLYKIIKADEHKGFIISVALIISGALGNILDSAFYGVLFSESDEFNVAQFLPADGGYAGFLYGRVVDMFYFPIWTGILPEWVPFWGGEECQFFRPIFNLADASISAGVILILLFQKRFFNQSVPVDNNPSSTE